jgi:sugar phosphate isomerase/epimerase
MPFDDMLDYVSSKGVEAIELGTGGYPGNAHCNVDMLLTNPQALQQFTAKG